MASVKKIIVTADDFGMSFAVNEAVEEAHRNGILTSASLMVTGEAAGDAIRRAHRMPQLGVGLHLTLISGPSALDQAHIPDLLAFGEQRVLHDAPWRIGTRIALSHHVQRQVRAEINAQLQLFLRSGLTLDHIDGHWHFHQHPSIFDILIQEAASASVRPAIRVPREPVLPSWRAAGRRGFIRRGLSAAAHSALTMRMRRRLSDSGFVSNDWFFGLNDGGAMDRSRLLGIAAHLPPGITEIGMHPERGGPSGSPFAPPPSWRLADEFAALIDPEVVGVFSRMMDARLVRFQDLD
ncbi:hopanoid biosynthesis-associated protein HpnK [Microvirga sp. 2TAF3]|uniref:hopanoid biosynthesis-associated protein HpnK n=1 Tax=Microvirga sp. 2TAF3 TaxID=3233014 RepID=UPI003F9B602E